ncbi:hypothetical protein RB653_009464 [Dictyostelium firmibasis]|uniref:Uncharacterized protein n=1 Tax=Dictyostelium firmibasis TaxID=79012 RepID=A0AAN7U152_9MYCE
MEYLNFSTISASLIGAGAVYALLKNKINIGNNSCGSNEFPTNVLKRWENLNNGYSWDMFLEEIRAIPDASKFKEHLDNCLSLKKSGNHYTALVEFLKIVTTIEKLKSNKNLYFITINDYINENKELSVMMRESVQFKDLMNAFLSEDAWINEKELAGDDKSVTYSYRHNGRQLKARKFVKVIDKPIKNLVLRTEEIQYFNNWKWYQEGTKLEDYKGTKLCRFISVLSRFILFNRAAYCWRLSFTLPDGSVIVSVNGANNRQSDYDLPPLPKKFSYPDIYFHAWRFIPLSPTKTIVISVMESDPKIWFLPFEAFIAQGRTFGSRELVLLDQHSTYIKGTEYEDCLDKNPLYKQIDNILFEKFNK